MKKKIIESLIFNTHAFLNLGLNNHFDAMDAKEKHFYGN
jgi:hypothetical protein